MKNYRDCIADAKILSETLEHLQVIIESFAEREEKNRKHAEEETDNPGSREYYEEEANECRAKAEAAERLLKKLINGTFK